jgi:S1-C subfamily serine protease
MLATAGVASGQEKSASDLFESVAGSIVILLAVDGQGQPVSQGSRLVIEPVVVVSNCHVVRQADGVPVKHAGQWYPAELRHVDAERDVCSFSVDGLRAPAGAPSSTSNPVEVRK